LKKAYLLLFFAFFAVFFFAFFFAAIGIIRPIDEIWRNLFYQRANLPTTQLRVADLKQKFSNSSFLNIIMNV